VVALIKVIREVAQLMFVERVRRIAATVATVLVLGACTSDGGDGTLRLYTSVTQGTVDAVVEAFGRDHPDVPIEVFRAPTGELTARIAAEQREGGIQADVIWLTDPLSMQQYDADELLLSFTPAEVGQVPSEFRADRFWGTRVLSMVIIQPAGIDPPLVGWTDLADPERAPVAVPDPGFAGSAFGAMGYLALADGFGFEFYERLAASGGVQVNSPGDVVTGVAEGRFAAGMTLAFSARAAIKKGSPIEIVWPAPGAIALYSPIAIFSTAANPDAAREFVDFVLTVEGQEAIAATGWQPVREDVAWTASTGPIVTPIWEDVFDRQDELLGRYREIFGG
jgi:iron(III) transport system substrate-binding protein